MRILIVNDYGSEVGGAEMYVFALRALLESRGHEVRLVADRPRLIHYVSRVFNPWYLVKFLAVIRSWKPDVVHIHKFNLVYSFAPSLAAKILGCRVVASVHDAGGFCPDGFSLRADGSVCEKYLDRHCFGSRCYRSTNWKLDLQRRLNFIRNIIQVPVIGATVDAFLCPSRAVRTWTAHYYGSRAHLVPLFTTVPKQMPSPPPRRGEGALRLFFAGRIVPEKGLQTVLAALSGLPVELVVAGDGPYRGELELIAARLGVSRQVRWLGKIRNEEIPVRIHEADACILPSIWLENNPIFGYETMKGARALLGSRVGGIPDMIEEGVNGYLFTKGNAEELRAVLERLLRDGNAADLGAHGYAKARRDYDPDDHYVRVMTFYRGENVAKGAARSR